VRIKMEAEESKAHPKRLPSFIVLSLRRIRLHFSILHRISRGNYSNAPVALLPDAWMLRSGPGGRRGDVWVHHCVAPLNTRARSSGGESALGVPVASILSESRVSTEKQMATLPGEFLLHGLS